MAPTSSFQPLHSDSRMGDSYGWICFPEDRGTAALASRQLPLAITPAGEAGPGAERGAVGVSVVSERASPSPSCYPPSALAPRARSRWFAGSTRAPEFH